MSSTRPLRALRAFRVLRPAVPYLLVGLGGALGTAARAALSLAVPSSGDVPLTTLGINVVGAFALGLFLTALPLFPSRPRRTDSLAHTKWRLFVGTGLLGGFTTYSALATDTALLITGGHLLAAIGYALGTATLGLIASALGVALGVRIGAA